MIKSKIPEMMEKQRVNATGLMREANISYSTAYHLSKGKLGTQISFDVLEKLCEFFDCEVGELLVRVKTVDSGK